MHVMILPSGQTLLHPQDTLPVPDMDIEAAQTALYALQEIPYFVIKAQRELAKTKAEIQILVEEKKMNNEQAMRDLLDALLEAEARIQAAQATAALIKF